MCCQELPALSNDSLALVVNRTGFPGGFIPQRCARAQQTLELVVKGRADQVLGYFEMQALRRLFWHGSCPVFHHVAHFA